METVRVTSMSDAQALAHNLKLRLLENYPEGKYLVEVLTSMDQESIRVVVKAFKTNKIHRCDYPVDGFHIERAIESISIDVPRQS